MSKKKQPSNTSVDPLTKLCFPDFDDYIKNERKTVELLANCGELATLGDSFDNAIQQLHATMQNWNDIKHRPVCIRFYATINSVVEDRHVKGGGTKTSKMHKVGFGAKVEFDDKHQLLNASYLIEIFGEENSDAADAILTRIHFDVVSRDDRMCSKYPLYHLQVGGNPSEGGYYSKDKRRNENMKALSYPRIPYCPLSLALFMDMVLRELGGCDAKVFLKSAIWRGVVRKSETMMLLPFLKCLCAGNENQDRRFSEMYYGSTDEA